MYDTHIQNPKQIPLQQSLDQLKKLQQLLQKKNDNKSRQNNNNKKPILQTHHRRKTQSYQLNNQQHNYQEPVANLFNNFDNNKYYGNKQYSGNPSTRYTYSQTKPSQDNHMECWTVENIVRENKKLKKYISSLLQMNDYLKNQLIAIQKPVFAKKHNQTSQLQQMRIKIQYLKELNREKQLQLQTKKVKKRYKQNNIKNKVKNKQGTRHVTITQNFGEKQPSHKFHQRSSSTYIMGKNNNSRNCNDNSEKSEYNDSYQYQHCSPRIIKCYQKTDKKHHHQIKQSLYNTNNRNSSETIKLQKKKIMEKEEQLKKCRKCRLCYF